VASCFFLGAKLKSKAIVRYDNALMLYHSGKLPTGGIIIKAHTYNRREKNDDPRQAQFIGDRVASGSGRFGRRIGDQ
jgi:hypothetical protein